MDKNQGTFVTDITNKDELNEIEKIQNILNPNEKVLLVARQSRFFPGGSALTPNIVIATDRRIIIRDPYDLGFRSEIVDIPYDVITSVKLMKGVLTSTILFKAPALVNKSKGCLMKILQEKMIKTELSKRYRKAVLKICWR